MRQREAFTDVVVDRARQQVVCTARAALEAAGCEVYAYDGSEISAKGDGGPTCLTAPIWRDDSHQ